MSEPLTEAQLLAMLSDVVGARSEASRSYWAAYYRDDVPRLVDEVHRLLAEVRRLRAENNRLCVGEKMASDKPWKPAGDTTAGAGLTLEARRAFLQLPAEDRRYLLTKMAADPGLIAHYEHEAGLERQLAEVRGGLAWALAAADADAVELGNLDRRCQQQQRMIAHLRDRLAKCQEHNRRLVQEAREAYRHVDSIIRRCGEEVAETERELAKCQAQAAALREALEAQGRLDDECETCAQAFDCPCFSPADGAECKLWAEVQAKKDAALAGDAGRAMVERVQKAEALAEEIKRIKIAWGRAMSVLRFFGSGVGMPDCSTCPDPDCDDGPCEEMETALDVMRGEWDAVEEDPDGVAAWEKWRQLEAVAKAAIAWVNACEACDNEPSELNEDIAGDAAGALEAAARRLRDGAKVEAAVDADEPTVAPPNTGWQQDYGRGVEEKES